MITLRYYLESLNSITKNDNFNVTILKQSFIKKNVIIKKQRILINTYVNTTFVK